MNNYSVKRLKAQLQNNMEFRRAVSARVSRVLVLPSRGMPMFKDTSGIDAATDAMPFLRSAVRTARAQLRRFTPVRVRVRREAVRAHVEQGADSGDDGGGSDDGDGGSGEGDCNGHSFRRPALANFGRGCAAVEFEQGKSIVSPTVRAQLQLHSGAGSCGRFFVPISRQEVAA